MYQRSMATFLTSHKQNMCMRWHCLLWKCMSSSILQEAQIFLQIQKQKQCKNDYGNKDYTRTCLVYLKHEENIPWKIWKNRILVQQLWTGYMVTHTYRARMYRNLLCTLIFIQCINTLHARTTSQHLFQRITLTFRIS